MQSMVGWAKCRFARRIRRKAQILGRGCKPISKNTAPEGATREEADGRLLVLQFIEFGAFLLAQQRSIGAVIRSRGLQAKPVKIDTFFAHDVT